MPMLRQCLQDTAPSYKALLAALDGPEVGSPLHLERRVAVLKDTFRPRLQSLIPECIRLSPRPTLRTLQGPQEAVRAMFRRQIIIKVSFLSWVLHRCPRFDIFIPLFDFRPLRHSVNLSLTLFPSFSHFDVGPPANTHDPSALWWFSL